jgi:predicted RNase H-like HicB family nuclease
MQNEFTAIIERDGEWYTAYCPEIPGANGQGRSKDEVRENLAGAIALILPGPQRRRALRRAKGRQLACNTCRNLAVPDLGIG